MASRTAVVILTWNRLKNLKNTISTFKKFNKNFFDNNIIIVDNGSIDKTPEYLKDFNFRVITNKKNLGAQRGKFIGWHEAMRIGYDFVLFLEDDFPCIRKVPIRDIERYLDENQDVGYVRLNKKKILKRHQISRMPIVYQPKNILNKEFNIQKSNYHFTCNPIMFRISLLATLDLWIDLSVETWKNFKYFEDNPPTHLAKKRVLKNFGISEKEYMRRYMQRYKWQAYIIPQCFKTVVRKRRMKWIN